MGFERALAERMPRVLHIRSSKYSRKDRDGLLKSFGVEGLEIDRSYRHGWSSALTNKHLTQYE